MTTADTVYNVGGTKIEKAWFVHVNGDIQQVKVVDNILYPDESKREDQVLFASFNSLIITDQNIDVWNVFSYALGYEVFLASTIGHAEVISESVRKGLVFATDRIASNLSKVINLDLVNKV